MTSCFIIVSRHSLQVLKGSFSRERTCESEEESEEEDKMRVVINWHRSLSLDIYYLDFFKFAVYHLECENEDIFERLIILLKVWLN